MDERSKIGRASLAWTKVPAIKSAPNSVPNTTSTFDFPKAAKCAKNMTLNDGRRRPATPISINTCDAAMLYSICQRSAKVHTLFLPLLMVAIAVEAMGLEPSPAPQITDVSDTAQIARIRDNFQRDLAHIGITNQILACNHVVTFVTDLGAGHDYSVGAVCAISDGKKLHHLLFCNDVMVGKFTMGGSDPNTREGVGRFVQNNCPPGG